MEWIKVSDRLPEKYCNVIVHREDGMVMEMDYGTMFGADKMTFNYNSDIGRMDQHKYVTHWMPLPEPPTI